MKSDKTSTGEGSLHPVSKVVRTLAAGAAVGLAAGILLAPAKGKKTRSKLIGEAKDLANRVKTKVNEAVPTGTMKK